jgi:Flp pilus assembly protein TadG
MITYRKSLLRRALTEQQGQVLPWVALMMGLFLGFGAFVLDVSHAYFCYHQLQAATDAAALAGAQSLNASSPNSIVDAFSALSGGNNAYSSLTLNGSNSVSMVPGYPKYTCLGSPITQAACVGPEDANAIQVAEQAIVPTFFARIFGINQMTLSATSTAAIVGARNEPTNIAVVLDTTASMKTVDSNCTVNGASAERIACAENGVSILLQDLSPCNTAIGCGAVSNGVAANALDSVAIFTFPNVTTGSTNDDFNCSGANPTIPVYSFPTTGSSTYAPTGSSTATYQITPFLSDYRSSDAASAGLVTGSELVMTTGSGKKNGSSCPGMSAPGGDGTYYAGVIYAAQSALTAQAASEVAADSTVVPVNIMIILSDGEANASSSKMATTTTGGVTVNRSNPWPSGGGATSYATNYPSALDQCQQAVAAANYAKQVGGTQVYTIAYGSESSGCTTDTTGPQKNITPCQVMSQMASATVYNSAGAVLKNYFFSDYLMAGGDGTCVSSAPVVDIAGIFQAIATNLLTVRLLPQSVWPSS